MAIVVDAMGGDNAPAEIVKGAHQAAETLRTRVTLVGRREVIERELAKLPGSSFIDVLDAPDVIEMHEHPAKAVRTKKQSSIVAGMDIVRQSGGAFVSAGNSGAVMASALLQLGRTPGVDRPALATVFPTRTGRVVLIDVGANTDVKPDWMRQFAVMGSLYAELALGIQHPTVGLLSNGEEQTKGSQLVQEAYPLIAASGVNFVGNVEGRDIPSGKVDVVVMDGFTGNVVIKLSEGLAEALFGRLREELTSKLHFKLATAVLRPALRKVAAILDYAEYGGAPLLGVKGLAVVAHGRSDARAIQAAVRVAKQAIDQNLTGAIANGIGAGKQESVKVEVADGTS